MGIVRTALVYAAATAAGVAVGLWTSGMTYLKECVGLCVIYPEQQFTAWQSALIGAAVLLAAIAAATAVSTGFRADTKSVVRWLNHDLLAEFQER